MENAPPADARVDAGANASCLPESFFQHMLGHNPFTLNRASSDGGEGADVLSIHSEVFVRLTELAGEAVRLKRGLGVLLASEAGAGKSHLFGRLARWSAVGSRACFVIVRGLQTDPDHLPAAIARSAGAAVAGRTGAAPARTPLYRLAHGAIRVALNDNQERYSWDRIGRAFAKLADRLAPAARRVPEGRAAFDLLYRFFRSATRAQDGKEDGATAAAILRWFTGGMLDAAEARKLHLPLPRHRDDPVTLSDPEWARQVLTALAVLATTVGKPLILAIDQAEELDTGRFAALARFLNGLLDHVPGLLAITAADTAAVLRWRDRGDVPNSAWNRLGQFTLEPARLRQEDGLTLLRRRLDDALSPFKDVEFLYRLRADAPLFPLHVEVNECGAWAREILESARLAWEREQEVLRREGGAEWLAGWAERMAQPTRRTASADAEAESSLTREQVQAAIALRARAMPTARDDMEVADEPTSVNADDEPPAREESAEPAVESSLTPEQLHTAIAGRSAGMQAPANGEISLTNDQLLAAAAWRGEPAAAEQPEIAPPSQPDVVEQPGATDEPPQSAHSMADIEIPETVAPDVIHKEVQATIDVPSSASRNASFADFDLSEPSAELAEQPTVPDPNIIRPSRKAEVPSAAPASESTVAFAPSGRRTILTPRAWPPSPPVPTPQEEAIDQAVGGVIAEYLAARAPRRELPADAEQIAELVLNLLQQCIVADAGYGVIQTERVPTWKATPAACDLVVRQQADGEATLRTGILVLTGSRATAIAGYLRRLTTESQPFDRLFLITEERVGLPLGPRGLEYLQELQQRSSVQLHTLELTVAEHTELSALRSVVRHARGGTLTVDGERVTEAEAIASLHRQQRYLASHFLSAILFDAPPTELIRQAPVMTQPDGK